MKGAYSTTPDTIAARRNRAHPAKEQHARDAGEEVGVQPEHPVQEAFLVARRSRQEHEAGARIDDHRAEQVGREARSRARWAWTRSGSSSLPDQVLHDLAWAACHGRGDDTVKVGACGVSAGRSPAARPRRPGAGRSRGGRSAAGRSRRASGGKRCDARLDHLWIQAPGPDRARRHRTSPLKSAVRDSMKVRGRPWFRKPVKPDADVQ